MASFRNQRCVPRYIFVPGAYFCVLILHNLWLSPTCSAKKFIPGFQDKGQFDIAWMGPLSDNYQEPVIGQESITLKTEDQEKYKCILPEVKEKNEGDGDILTGIPPEELLHDVLHGHAKCSYRLEPYWTYEVCHGSHVRQFHEEKDSEGVTKVQEFYLGKLLDKEKQKDSSVESNKEESTTSKGGFQKRKVQMMSIDGRNTPYYSRVIGNGTPCDLNNGKPRQVNIVYICHAYSNNEVMSVKESTTCEYEVIILNPNLCANPVFKIKDDPVLQIKCHSLDGSPSRPTLLINHEINSELSQLPFEKQFMVEQKVLPTEQPAEEPIHNPATEEVLKGETVTEEFQGQGGKAEDFQVQGGKAEDSSTQTLQGKREPPPEAQADDQLTKQFLAGEYCLRGGSGWWKYEFCYGKHISQYHEEPRGRTTIYIGYWDAATHLEWLKENKKRVKYAKYIVNFYSNGEMCDLTGKPRNAQVKLKCKKERQGQEMSIYLLEPSPCEYVIGVESPVLCPLVSRADENGLIDYEY